MDFSFLDLTDSGLLLALGVAGALLVWIARTFFTSGHAPGRPRALDAVDTVGGWPPESTRVLTPGHLRALHIVNRALPDRLVLAQVPISHFVKVPTRHSYAEWMRRVGHICIDLMICDSASNVLAVIEVRTGDRPETERARKRGKRIERVLNRAGVPLHIWNEAMLPDVSSVRRSFAPEPAASLQEPGPDTRPLERPERHDQRDPPRTSWFDDLNATRPNALDRVEVVHGETPPSVDGRAAAGPRLGAVRPGKA
ncbi:uncharacterized protein DUF2726 [Sphaerotilus hippei]|uniref:Uncharacterized protein DUF2726 n=1 Tax=Sphaerotilus hippei TaxID=744406 RepID=A0A318H108_9BURK|nr:DUF2726 domain-containing protein [Sphaerotilus hippei]PXW95869.1 uncharacterized protein DUF2726 [Sphaerotilus hippei]